MDPGSPTVMWPLRMSKPDVTGPVAPGGEDTKADERSQSPSLAERLSAAPSPTSPAPASPSPPQHQFQASLVAEKYLLLEQVEGSSLCRCVDVRTQEEYVCKVVSRDCSSLLQAHYRLDGHPHVNPIHEVLVGDKRVYLIFPRSHSDLHSYVRARKRLREHEARRLFRQMAETVAACHEQGIVLRDLKLRKFVFADPQR
ncbi:tribbles homolog 2-like isoform X2 [Leptidea sinapis]|nr:tribbles homolog 2-like isoform X2 [Leptidea sinapis]